MEDNKNNEYTNLGYFKKSNSKKRRKLSEDQIEKIISG